MNSGKNFCPAWSDYGILQWRIQELWKGWAGNPNSSILRPKIGQNRQKQQQKFAEKRGGGRGRFGPLLDPPLSYVVLITNTIHNMKDSFVLSFKSQFC